MQTEADETDQYVTSGAAKLFWCNFCEFLLNSAESLISHVNINHSESCLNRLLNEHSLAADGEILEDKTFKCKHCEKICLTGRNFKLHFHEKHRETIPNQCFKCQAKFHSFADLRAHFILIHSGADLFFCTKCGMSIQTKTQLRGHFKLFHYELIKKRGYINYFSYEKTNLGLKTHGSNVSDPSNSEELEVYECIYCEKDFKQVMHVRSHLQIIHSRDLRALCCSECGRYFKGRHFLNRHFKTCHFNLGRLEKPLVCGDCQKTFIKRSSLKRHFKELHNSYNHVECTLCLDEFEDFTYFSSQEKLDTHVLNVHKEPCEDVLNSDDDRIVNCQKCLRIFKNTKCLINHIRFKHYTKQMCYCGSEFKSREELIQHIAETHNKNSFICGDCGNSYQGKHEVESHIKKIHNHNITDIPKCIMCEIIYGNHIYCSTLSQLNLHLETMHHENCLDTIHKCLYCEKTYDSFDSLHLHLIKAHPNSRQHERKEGEEKYTLEGHQSGHIQNHHTGNNNEDDGINLNRQSQEDIDDSRAKRFGQNEDDKIHGDGKGKIDIGMFTCTLGDKVIKDASVLKMHIRTCHSGKVKTCPDSQVGLEDLTARIHSDKRVFECAQCGEKFNGKKLLKHHVRGHMSLPQSAEDKVEETDVVKQETFSTNDAIVRSESFEPVACPTCGKLFKSKSSLNSHVHQSHSTDTKMYQCQICDRQFKKPFNLKKHVGSVHQTERPYLCNHCGTSFKLEGNLKMHVKKVHLMADLKPFKCDHCDKEFKNNQSLKMHVRIHTDDYVEQCRICDKKFYEMRFYVAHMTQHHSNEIPYKCSYCNKGFKLKHRLANHLREVHQKKSQPARVQCPQCSQQFTHKTTLLVHQRRKHTFEYVKECKACDKKFYLTRDYTSHMLSKHSEPTLPCDVCGKLYPTKASLNQHKRIHEENYKEKYFKECPICNKKFRSLTIHMRDFHASHGNNYVCHLCGKSYREKNTLKLHLMIHNNIRPHQCSFCGKRFLTNQHLLTHTRQHTGEAAHPCSYCEKRFTTNRAKLVHERLHQGYKPFQCELCSASFHDKRFLSRHHKKKHVLQNVRFEVDSDVVSE